MNPLYQKRFNYIPVYQRKIPKKFIDHHHFLIDSYLSDVKEWRELDIVTYYLNAVNDIRNGKEPEVFKFTGKKALEKIIQSRVSDSIKEKFSVLSIGSAGGYQPP